MNTYLHIHIHVKICIYVGGMGGIGFEIYRMMAVCLDKLSLDLRPEVRYEIPFSQNALPINLLVNIKNSRLIALLFHTCIKYDPRYIFTSILFTLII